MTDPVIQAASEIVRQTDPAAIEVKSFLHEPSSTFTHVLSDRATGKAAIIDSVLDYNPAPARTLTQSADIVMAYVREQGFTVEWQLETHVHAEHLSAAPYLQEQLGGKLGIGRHIITVQETFGKIFNEGPNFARDGSQFDYLFNDGERFSVGSIPAIAMHVPGHTPADMAYVIGNTVFIGDTMFMPDYGTARADFPGGDARSLYRSIRRLLSLPDEARLFMCHDYKAPGRDVFMWEASVADQRRNNVHVHDGVSEEDFVTLREARDATLEVPLIILPSIQVNMRAGHLPDAEDNGVRYLKIPLNRL